MNKTIITNPYISPSVRTLSIVTGTTFMASSFTGEDGIYDDGWFTEQE